MGSIELVSAPAAFPGRLAAWSDPSFVAPSIGSGRRLDGPSGVIELDGPERRGPTVSRALAPSTAPMVRVAPGAMGGPSSAETEGEGESFEPEPIPEAAAPEEVAPSIPEAGPAPVVAAPTVARLAERPAAAGGPRLPATPAGPGPVASGAVRPLAQRIQQAVQRSVRGRAAAAPDPAAAPAPIRVQREAHAPELRSMDARRSLQAPAVPPSAPTPVDTTSDAMTTVMPDATAEPQSDLPSVASPSGSSAGPGSPAPMIQRTRLDPIARIRGTVAGTPDVVAATDVPARQTSPQPPGAPAPGVLQRVIGGTPAVQPVESWSSPSRSELPMAPTRPSPMTPPVPAGSSALAEAFAVADPLTPAEPAQEEPPSRSALPPLVPRGSGTVVDLQRWTGEPAASPSSTERRLDGAPVSIGGSAAGASGPARRPLPTMRFGEPLGSAAPIAMQGVQRLAVARSSPGPHTGSTAAHPQVLRPVGRIGVATTGDDAVVQRAESDGASPAAPPPEPVAVEAPPAGGAPAVGTSGGAPAAPSAAPTSREDLDRLAASLMPALLWRIKAELVTERERRGVRSDRF